MSGTMTVQIAQRGVVTLPKSIREAYGLQPGDTLTLLELGGVLLLSPRCSEVDALADRITQALTERGGT
jgi:AbrB family looped-hinge helix DNA binding protein